MARPRKADRLEIPTAAVDRAIALIEADGVETLTLGAIARGVGCSPPALYRYFDSKDALLDAVHDEGFRRLYAGKQAAGRAAGDDPVERLRLGGLGYVAFARANPGLYGVMFGARAPALRRTSRGDTQAPPGDVADPAGRSIAFLRESVERCQVAGYLPGLDPTAAAFTFWSTVHGAIALDLQRRGPFEGDTPLTSAERAVETVMALVRVSGVDRQ